MKSFICGFTGSGKTTYLNILKKQNEYAEYIDLDEYILKNCADGYKQVADLIEKEGFDNFRQVEFNALEKIVSLENVCLALGGGTLNDKTLNLLVKNKFEGLFLNTDFEVCYQRIKDDPGRPISKFSKDKLLKLYNERLSYYRRFKQIQVR